MHTNRRFFFAHTFPQQITERFLKALDLTSAGVIQSIREYDALLFFLDRPLWCALDRLGIDPRFYAFRWITLFLSQEFELPDLLRVWDSLFADPHKFRFLLFICVALIRTVRLPILATQDFSLALKIVQRPSIYYYRGGDQALRQAQADSDEVDILQRLFTIESLNILEERGIANASGVVVETLIDDAHRLRIWYESAAKPPVFHYSNKLPPPTDAAVSIPSPTLGQVIEPMSEQMRLQVHQPPPTVSQRMNELSSDMRRQMQVQTDRFTSWIKKTAAAVSDSILSDR